jgi:hypothetical protein
MTISTPFAPDDVVAVENLIDDVGPGKTMGEVAGVDVPVHAATCVVVVVVE